MPDAPSEKKPSRQKRIDWDGAWKEAIQQFLPAFLQLLFPDVHAVIDWTQEPVFLEQELRHVTRRAKRGKGAVDKLARVRLLDGRQTTLLIHIEFQHQLDLDLPARLYTYNIRIYSLLQEPVITLAVLGDDDPHWRPTTFGYAIAGFATQMRFPVAKLLDYEPQWPMLEQSANPFAVIVMSHLKALATMGQPESRLEWKLRLATALYGHDYSEARVQQLFDFIDWLLVLDDRREARFDDSIRRFEEEQIMPTITRFEKRCVARGHQEGQQEGQRASLLNILEARFEVVPEDIIESVQRIERRDLLMNLQRAAVQIATLEEFRSLLAA
jgi:hypothetical protein